MWKYLKDYLIGKLLKKWISTTITTDPSNASEAFLHYQNIELNPESFNNSILDNYFNYYLNYGTIEKLNVSINWKEIFRYWTDIRAKYHIETEEEEEDGNILENAENSLIKIKGLVLNLNTANIHKDYDGLADDPMINSIDVDLMKDFLNHIIGQFRLEIEGVKIILNEDLVVIIPNIIVLPESNGLRKITINEDITITSSSTDTNGRISKGIEIWIMRVIEGYVIKIKVSGIEIKANYMNSLIKLLDTIKFENRNSNTRMEMDYAPIATTSIIIDTFKLSIGPLILFLHDICIENTGAFVLGHFNLKLKEHSIVMSPVQTHVVTGDYKNNRMMIEEEIVIKLRDFNQLEEINNFFTFEKSENNNTKYQIDMRSVILVIDELSTTIHDIKFHDKLVSICNAIICHDQSKLYISNIKYITRPNTRSLNISPLADLKRFIENDEIVSIADEIVLYENFKGLINQLDIETISGSIEINEIEYVTKILSTSNAKDTSNATILLSVMGTIDKVNVSLNLPSKTIYQAQLNSISFLKAEGFVDLRARLNYFKRNARNLMHSADLIVVKTEDITAVSIENLNLILPFNLSDILRDDINCISSLLPFKTESAKENDFQLSLKNSKIKLEAPDDLKEPAGSEFLIKEINCKLDVLYVDEAILKLSSEIIFNSGLIKISYNSNSLEVINHCSDIYLNSQSYQNLIKFATFWSEIYSPVIEEIQPEAVFHNESSFEDNEVEEDEGINAILMKFEDENGQENEDFELELEIGVTESETEETGTNDGSIDNNTEAIINDDPALTDLLKEIDNDFFINKPEEIVEENYFMKISNFGIKINLLLSNSSNDNLTISLNGISGSISSGRINLSFKEGSIHKNSKTIMHRWPRGPDITFKYPIEDSNFVTIKAEKLGIKNDAGIDEYNLMISICPLRLFLDQKSLNDISNFFKNEPLKLQQHHLNDKLRSFMFFNKVKISPLALKIDFNPNSTSSTNAPIPLQGAEIILPRVELRGVKGFEGLGPAVFSTWVPELKGKKLTGVLTTGLVPVRTIVNLGGGVAELILLPWQLGSEQSAAQTAAQIRKNGKRIGLETLKLTASLASRTSKLLSTQSPSANYPADFQSGVQQAAQLIIALPTRLGQSNKGALRAVPLIILDSAATATGALAKTLQGIQAEFDREIDYERKIKRK